MGWGIFLFGGGGGWGIFLFAQFLGADANILL